MVKPMNSQGCSKAYFLKTNVHYCFKSSNISFLIQNYSYNMKDTNQLYVNFTK